MMHVEKGTDNAAAVKNLHVHVQSSNQGKLWSYCRHVRDSPVPISSSTCMNLSWCKRRVSKEKTAVVNSSRSDSARYLLNDTASVGVIANPGR